MTRLPMGPRPLTVSERAVLEHILSADFAGAPTLRSRLDRTEVVALWASGPVSVDLLVRGPVQRATMPAAAAAVRVRSG